MKKTPLVFFNASVILSALKSDKGGSHKLTDWVSDKKITGVISEVIYSEAVSKLNKISIDFIDFHLLMRNFRITHAPFRELVNKYKKYSVDPGDVHVLASAVENKADYLVSLDKKHILAIKGKVKEVKIVSPKELIEEMR